MKKITITLFALALISSCKKEKEPDTCTCGLITNKTEDQFGRYYLTIESECSGISKVVEVTLPEYFDHEISQRFCAEGIDPW
jgi:hypothetical protein